MNPSADPLPVAFGSYTLFDSIGKGGMAEIFLARARTEIGAGRLCVIKRILPEFNRDESFCEMLINEARICAHLSHANVVKTYELGHIDDQYYIAMEYVEGMDLNRLLGVLTKKGIALPVQFALYIIAEVLKGLDYAHRAGDDRGQPLHIIHRDVSPTNVLISAEGEVKLCDFGIAKVMVGELSARDIHLDDAHIKGKIAYMAPEHVAGGDIDQRADLFAVGILLWELLSGRRLYRSKDPDETLKRALAADIPDVEDAGFPEYEMLTAIVRRALSRDRERRFCNGQEFLRAIEDYLHVVGLPVSQFRFAEFLASSAGDALAQQHEERESRLAQLGKNEGTSTGPIDTAEGLVDRFTLSLLQDVEEAGDDRKSDGAPDLLAEKFERERRGQPLPPVSMVHGDAVERVLPWLLMALALAAACALAAQFNGLF